MALTRSSQFLLPFLALTSAACAGTRERGEREPLILARDDRQPLARREGVESLDDCPAVDPAEGDWAPLREVPKAWLPEHLDGWLVRATLFGVWDRMGEGCLRVDTSRPPGPSDLSSRVTVELGEGPLLLPGNSARHSAIQAIGDDTVFSLEIPVRCFEGDDCLLSDLIVRHVVLQGDNKIHRVELVSPVPIRSGREP